ncbi:DUF4259 domain-containing protein [Streptomyces sp. ML-6]|nr:DUF4259 domain-containing protein [Streptomyces sp. ML-6]MDK0522193.1 DUF4259 domain-containing protein [Streptomyces sp. ML-6]
MRTPGFLHDGPLPVPVPVGTDARAHHDRKRGRGTWNVVPFDNDIVGDFRDGLYEATTDARKAIIRDALVRVINTSSHLDATLSEVAFTAAVLGAAQCLRRRARRPPLRTGKTSPWPHRLAQSRRSTPPPSHVRTIRVNGALGRITRRSLTYDRRPTTKQAPAAAAGATTPELIDVAIWTPASPPPHCECRPRRGRRPPSFGNPFTSPMPKGYGAARP